MKKFMTELFDGLLKPVNAFSPLLIGLFTSLWGLWLISPFWETYTSAPVFHHIENAAPEWAWGSWSFISGLLVVYYTVKQKFKGLSNALGFLFLHWVSVSWLMWRGDWHNTAGLTYSMAAIYCFYLFENVRMNYVND